MQVLDKLSVKKRDHDKAFGNLHHWIFNVAAPNKHEKKKENYHNKACGRAAEAQFFTFSHTHSVSGVQAKGRSQERIHATLRLG